MNKLLALCICLVLTACGGLSTEQRKEAREAVEALQKIQAGVESGKVSQMTIAPMIIEAKAQVNQARAVLPEGDLKKNLDIAIDAYIDATTLWSKGVMEAYKYECNDSTVAEYRRKYPNNPDLADNTKCMSDKSVTYLFSLASENVDKAAANAR